MQNESLFAYLRGRLFQRVLLAVAVAVILLSGSSLFLTLRNFDELGANVSATLEQGQHRIDDLLTENQTRLGESVRSAEQSSSQLLSGYLESQLKDEMGVMQATLRTALSEGGRLLGTLVASIAPEPILKKDFTLLTGYVKTISQQPAVVYAVFYRADGTPYTRYVNRKDPRVQDLLAQGAGRTGLDRLLNAARDDAAIEVVQEDIRLGDQLLGSIRLGLSTAEADQALSAMRGRMDQLVASSSDKVNEVLQSEGQDLARGLAANFTSIRDASSRSSDAAREVIEHTAGSLIGWQTLMAVVAGLFITGGLSWYFAARIIGPIRRLTLTMEDIASGEGDLTRRLPGNDRDEIGRLGAAFNHFVEKIQGVIARAGQSTGSLTSAAEQLAQVADENSGSMNAQRGETEQVATAITQMAATVREVAASAESAAEAAKEANREATEGKSVVAQTVAAINALAGQVEQASEVINRLEADSTAIGAVLDVIRNIADQTNLLALNAAIEAARAGDQGRGFAVVAEEVRSLASRTQESTQEIHEMIERVQSGTRAAVEVMTSGVATTRETVESASRAGASLDHIVQTVGTITAMNNQIARAAEEQTDVAGEIDRRVVQISELSSGTARSTEQIAGAGRDLAQLGEELRRLVTQFRV